MSDSATPFPSPLALEWDLSWSDLVKGRRWIWTLLVIGIVCADLGLARWQFQRYQVRRAEQTQLHRQARLPALQLTALENGATASERHFRRALAEGVFDFESQFAWVGPKDRMSPGPHLVTPLHLADGSVVLVDRGWMPRGFDEPARWAEFNRQPSRPLQGILLPGTPVPDPETLDGQPRPVLFWARMDIPRIQAQLPYAVAPYYLHLEPGDEEGGSEIPARTWYTVRTPPSMHLGYVAQWIMAAVTVAVFYLLILRFLKRSRRLKAQSAEAVNEVQPLAGEA